MFRTVPLSIIKSFSLYTQQWYLSYRFADSLRAGSGRSQAVGKPVWHIPLLCLQWKTPDDGQRNCPKHVEFYSKNKFEKLVHLVGFVIRISDISINYELQENLKIFYNCLAQIVIYYGPLTKSHKCGGFLPKIIRNGRPLATTRDNI